MVYILFYQLFGSFYVLFLQLQEMLQENAYHTLLSCFRNEQGRRQAKYKSVYYHED